jgi:hypothetical protein
MDRRGFLRTTAGGAAAITLASLLPAGCGREYPQAASDNITLKSLTAKEYATARAAAEAMLPGVPVSPAHVAALIDNELSLAGEPMLTDMKTVLGLMEHGTVMSFKGKRFTALSVDARRKVLEDWATSRINLRRGAFLALKGFVVYFAYIEDATRPLTGFPGPLRERVVVPPYVVDFGEIA